MGKATGFIEIARKKQPTRPVAGAPAATGSEVYLPYPDEALREQAARCMDCGIPFCHQGCPLGNLIPDWNDLVYRDRWQAAIDRLHATNNFPEFTGRLCPAPCEGACVLGINNDPVTIKAIESLDHRSRVRRRLGRAAAAGDAHRQARRGRRIGPGGPGRRRSAEPGRALVTVFERADRIGGLLRYGIPEFKMEKRVLDRRLDADGGRGRRLPTSANVGVNVPVDELRREFDAIVLAGGVDEPARPAGARPRAARASTSRWTT